MGWVAGANGVIEIIIDVQSVIDGPIKGHLGILGQHEGVAGGAASRDVVINRIAGRANAGVSVGFGVGSAVVLKEDLGGGRSSALDAFNQGLLVGLGDVAADQWAAKRLDVVSTN